MQSNHFKMASKTKTQTEDKNKKTERVRRNCLRKCFHTFRYIIDHTNVPFFFYVNSLHCFVWFPVYYLLHLFGSDCFAALTSLWPYKFLFKYMNFLKTHPQKKVFCNVNRSNLEVIWKKCKNSQGQGIHFLRHKFWIVFCSVPTMVVPSDTSFKMYINSDVTAELNLRIKKQRWQLIC